MQRINVNGPNSDPHWYGVSKADINGCSGHYWALTNDVPDDTYFLTSMHRNVWDLLGTDDFGGEGWRNRRLNMVMLPSGFRLTPPTDGLRKHKEYHAFRVKSGRRTIAVLGTSRPEYFENEASPAATFWVDPQASLDMSHFHTAGLWGKPAEHPDADRHKIPELRGYPKLLVATRGGYGSYMAAHAWSHEFRGVAEMPWWERLRARGQVPHTAEELVGPVCQYLSQMFRNKQYPEFPLAWFAGNALVNHAGDSFRQVFLMHSLNPEATFDLEASPYIEHQGERVFYKVLPFYFHSPQHRDHRCAAVFFSPTPIHLERV